MNEIIQKRIEEAASHYLLHEHKSPLNEILHQCDLKTEMQYHRDIEQAYIEGGKNSLQNQWISVEEALPEEEFDDGYKFVFVIVKIDEETSCYDTDYIRNGKWEFHDADKVTHWAEIPSLKGGEK
jgi:hypothetical protein